MDFGLCATCQHQRLSGNKRGSIFSMCQRSKQQPEFRKYPPLPVLQCHGYEEKAPSQAPLKADPT